jgi:1-acyl-sn-glycerol-3-phosphate acyltransferase
MKAIWLNSRMASRGMYGGSEWVEGSLTVFRLLEDVGIKFEITGMSNIKELEGPAVFIGNHMSALETFILPCIIQPRKPVTFVVKKMLVDVPVFGSIMRSRDPVVVGRLRPREDLRRVLEEGTEKIGSGTSIIIFPQSTRSVFFRPDEFNTLGVKLALRSGVPVVPFALKTDAWGIGRLFKDFGSLDTRKTAHFAFGKKMNVEGRGAAEHQKVIAFIKEKLKEWGKGDAYDYKQ